MNLQEKLSIVHATADHAIKGMAEQAGQSLPAVKAAGGAVMAAAPALEAVEPVLEAMSEPEGQNKIGKVAWSVADYIIDVVSRYFTGGVPVYRFAKNAIGAASEATVDGGEDKPAEE